MNIPRNNVQRLQTAPKSVDPDKILNGGVNQKLPTTLSDFYYKSVHTGRDIKNSMLKVYTNRDNYVGGLPYDPQQMVNISKANERGANAMMQNHAIDSSRGFTFQTYVSRASGEPIKPYSAFQEGVYTDVASVLGYNEQKANDSQDLLDKIQAQTYANQVQQKMAQQNQYNAIIQNKLQENTDIFRNTKHTEAMRNLAVDAIQSHHKIKAQEEMLKQKYKEVVEGTKRKQHIVDVSKVEDYYKRQPQKARAMDGIYHDYTTTADLKNMINLEAEPRPDKRHKQKAMSEIFNIYLDKEIQRANKMNKSQLRDYMSSEGIKEFNSSMNKKELINALINDESYRQRRQKAYAVEYGKARRGKAKVEEGEI